MITVIMMITTTMQIMIKKIFFIYQAATPILKMLKSGELIEIETPETRLATKYKNMHNSLR